MKYEQLTIEKRYQIYAYSKANWSQKDMATELKVHRTTIYREKKRNKGQRGYRPQQANLMSQERKQTAKKGVKMTPYLKFMVAQKIRDEWSPEQISGYFKKSKNLNISHQAIYDFVREDRLKNGTLYKHLRQSNKKKKKQYGSIDVRGQIKNRTMIDERPSIVDAKLRIGDWEADTVIGKNHKGVLVTMVERKSKFIVACPVSNKSETAVTNAMIKSLNQHRKNVHTITVDNGKEFAGHEKIAKKLGAKIYFAHPYSSWERGLNENSNGLLRQYFPKKTDLRSVNVADMNLVLEKINNRPRKSLGYATPKEIFFGLINGNNLEYQNVALIS